MTAKEAKDRMNAARAARVREVERIGEQYLPVVLKQIGEAADSGKYSVRIKFSEEQIRVAVEVRLEKLGYGIDSESPTSFVVEWD